jgi:hypothetical protein
MGKLPLWALPLALLPLLAGCQAPGGTLPPYIAPTDGDTARLLFRGKVVPGVGYLVYAFDDPDTCNKPLLIGKGNYVGGPASSSLRAGPLATLQYFSVDRQRRTCRVAISFYPTVRHTYVLFTEQDTVGCRIRLLDATDAEDMKVVRAYPRRLNGRACQPMTQVSRPTDESAGSTSGGTSQPSRELEDYKDLLPAQ